MRADVNSAMEKVCRREYGRLFKSNGDDRGRHVDQKPCGEQMEDEGVECQQMEDEGVECQKTEDEGIECQQMEDEGVERQQTSGLGETYRWVKSEY